MNSVPIKHLDDLPKVSGIYRIVTASGKTVYVGQSVNIHQRWNGGHEKLAKAIAQFGGDIKIAWTPVPQWLLNRAEHTAVAYYKPELNRKTPSVV